MPKPNHNYNPFSPMSTKKEKCACDGKLRGRPSESHSKYSCGAEPFVCSCGHVESAHSEKGCRACPCLIKEVLPPSQSESIEWEKQFDEVYNSLGLDHVESFGKRSNRETLKCYIRGYIWDSITTAVAKRELEIAEEVNKILPKDWMEKASKAHNKGDMYTGGFFMGMFDTIQKVLSILKH